MMGAGNWWGEREVGRFRVDLGGVDKLMEGLWSEGNGDPKDASKGKMEASHFL